VSLGAYSVFTLPFVLRGAISPDRRTALLGRMASVAVLGTVMLSQTRMAMLAVPFVVVTLLGVRHRQAADGARGMATGITTSERRRPRRVVIAVALVAVLGMVGLFGASTLNSQGEILGAAIAYKGQGNGANARSQSVAGRTSLYLTAWHALLARPLVGYGMRVPTQDAQNSVFRHYGQSYAFESYDVVLPLEVGAVGLLAAIVTVIALVRVVRRRIRSTIDRATVYAALIAGLVMAIGSNPFDIEVTYLWMVLGLWIGACLERAPNSAVADEPSYRAAWRQR
jgi:O-antigen ligase